jgi:hypothetical protein
MPKRCSAAAAYSPGQALRRRESCGQKTAWTEPGSESDSTTGQVQRGLQESSDGPEDTPVGMHASKQFFRPATDRGISSTRYNYV